MFANTAGNRDWLILLISAINWNILVLGHISLLESLRARYLLIDIPWLNSDAAHRLVDLIFGGLEIIHKKVQQLVVILFVHFAEKQSKQRVSINLFFL